MRKTQNPFPISFPEAAILLVSIKDTNLWANPNLGHLWLVSKNMSIFTARKF